MRQVFLAGKEAQEWPALLCDVIADCPAQHGIAGLNRVEDRSLRHGTLDLEFQVAANLRQRPEMRWEYDSDHI
jgi:hypothetical protein